MQQPDRDSLAELSDQLLTERLREIQALLRSRFLEERLLQRTAKLRRALRLKRFKLDDIELEYRGPDDRFSQWLELLLDEVALERGDHQLVRGNRLYVHGVVVLATGRWRDYSRRDPDWGIVVQGQELSFTYVAGACTYTVTLAGFGTEVLEVTCLFRQWREGRLRS
jgi:hypothetical protein